MVNQWWIVVNNGILMVNNYSGWWFGTMEFYDFPYIGNFIIPTDFHIFQRVETTNQNSFMAHPARHRSTWLDGRGFQDPRAGREGWLGWYPIECLGAPICFGASFKGAQPPVVGQRFRLASNVSIGQLRCSQTCDCSAPWYDWESTGCYQVRRDILWSIWGNYGKKVGYICTFIGDHTIAVLLHIKGMW